LREALEPTSAFGVHRSFGRTCRFTVWSVDDPKPSCRFAVSGCESGLPDNLNAVSYCLVWTRQARMDRGTLTENRLEVYMGADTIYHDPAKGISVDRITVPDRTNQIIVRVGTSEYKPSLIRALQINDYRPLLLRAGLIASAPLAISSAMVYLGSFQGWLQWVLIVVDLVCLTLIALLAGGRAGGSDLWETRHLVANGFLQRLRRSRTSTYTSNYHAGFHPPRDECTREGARRPSSQTHTVCRNCPILRNTGYFRPA
jgi:hypothetical protein